MALFRNELKGDSVLTIFALCAMLLAGGLSLATITTDFRSATGNRNQSLNDPLTRAELAANAGISAARGHIECHGILDSGGLPEQYYANGARFKVSWDDIDLKDSTVHIVSAGFVDNAAGETYTSKLESIIKVDLLSVHDRPIFHEYYDRNVGYEGTADVHNKQSDRSDKRRATSD